MSQSPGAQEKSKAASLTSVFGKFYYTVITLRANILFCCPPPPFFLLFLPVMPIVQSEQEPGF